MAPGPGCGRIFRVFSKVLQSSARKTQLQLYDLFENTAWINGLGVGIF
jgi:hypothetical protein